MFVQIITRLFTNMTSRALIQMNLSYVYLESIFGYELLFTDATFRDLVMTMLFENVPPQVCNWKALVAELTRYTLIKIIEPLIIFQVCFRGCHFLTTDLKKKA